MTDSINKVTLIGYVGNNPEMRNTQDGGKIAKFSLATHEYPKDKKTGETKRKTEWHKISVLYKRLVDVVENKVKKGSRLYIEGTLRSNSWYDSRGLEKIASEVRLGDFCSKLITLDKKPSEDEEPYKPVEKKEPKVYDEIPY